MWDLSSLIRDQTRTPCPGSIGVLTTGLQMKSQQFLHTYSNTGASLKAQLIESACNAGDLGLIPRSGRIPWRRKWQPTPVFLPGESHGQRNLAGYKSWTQLSD